jgi:hypothetical protein
MTASVGVVNITPKKAREILANNTRNRRVRRAYVARLADAIRRGEWELNGEPIQIAADGTLLNGQHRLLAIVEANVPAKVVLVEGLPGETQDTIDTGSRRRLADVLALRGEADANNLAAALNLLHRYRNGLRMDTAGQNAPTPQQAIQLLEDEPGLTDSLKVGRKVHRETKMSATVATVMYHLFAEVDQRDADEFFRLLCESDPRDSTDPIRRLRTILARAAADQHYRPTIYVLCAVTIKAFNAWRLGQPVQQLSFRPGGRSPEVFPQIKPLPE